MLYRIIKSMRRVMTYIALLAMMPTLIAVPLSTKRRESQKRRVSGMRATGQPVARPTGESGYDKDFPDYYNIYYPRYYYEFPYGARKAYRYEAGFHGGYNGRRGGVNRPWAY